MCLSADKVFMMEDKIMRQPGLYLMWTILFVVNLICLSIDSTTGPIRDFNVLAQFLSTIYSLVSSVNNIYGNKLPSTMLLTAGPVHQYTTWLLLAYYRGNVYSSSAIGIYNGVVTVVIGIFTADMVIKTWTVAINPKYYLDYVKKKTDTVATVQQQQVDVEIVEQKSS